MGLHVPGELAALGTGVGTQLTLVRLLSRVRSPVDCQVGTVLENLPTVLASVLTTTSNQLLTGGRVKYSVQSAFLGQSFDCTRLHRGQLDPRRKGRQRNVLQGRPPSSPSSSPAPEVDRARHAVLDSRHPETSEEVLLLPGHQPRPAPHHGPHLAPQPSFELSDVVVDILLETGVSVLLQGLPVRLLKEIEE